MKIVNIDLFSYFYKACRKHLKCINEKEGGEKLSQLRQQFCSFRVYAHLCASICPPFNMNKLEKIKTILNCSELFPLKTHFYDIQAAICKTMLRLPIAI